jgi:dsDNA-specific endonuclease/ATPase MutS2
VAILNYLSNKNCLVIATTHDIELTQLIKNNYENYHFCENIKENDIASNIKFMKVLRIPQKQYVNLSMLNFHQKLLKLQKRIANHNIIITHIPSIIYMFF